MIKHVFFGDAIDSDDQSWSVWFFWLFQYLRNVEGRNERRQPWKMQHWWAFLSLVICFTQVLEFRARQGGGAREKHGFWANLGANLGIVGEFCLLWSDCYYDVHYCCF